MPHAGYGPDWALRQKEVGRGGVGEGVILLIHIPTPTCVTGRGKSHGGCFALPSIWRPPMLEIILASLKSYVYLTLGGELKVTGWGGGGRDLKIYICT